MVECSGPALGKKVDCEASQQPAGILPPAKMVGTVKKQGQGLFGAGICQSAGPSALQIWHCSWWCPDRSFIHLLTDPCKNNEASYCILWCTISHGLPPDNFSCLYTGRLLP